MAGTEKMTAEKLLVRLKKLKTQVDNGKVQFIHKAAVKHLKTATFVKALLKRNVVHVNKDGTVRWNGLAVNTKLAQSIIDDAHAHNKKYWKSNKKVVSKEPAAKNKTEEEVDAVTGLEASELKRLRKILESGVEIENMLSEMSSMNADVRKALNTFSSLRYDMNRIQKEMHDLHLDHIEKNQIIESLTPTDGS